MTSPPSPVQAPLVAFEPSLEVESVSGANKYMVSDEFILKTFERLTTKNSEVKEKLKRQDEKTNMLVGILGELLSRLPPFLNPSILKKTLCLFHFCSL